MTVPSCVSLKASQFNPCEAKVVNIHRRIMYRSSLFRLGGHCINHAMIEFDLAVDPGDGNNENIGNYVISNTRC